MQTASPPWRSWTTIDPAAVRANAQWVQRRTRARLLAVVKADAYGHGVDIVVPALLDLADSFAVANPVEATEVRALAPDHDILLLSPCLPTERAGVVAAGWIPTISSAPEAAEFSRLAHASGRTARLHLKFDTGMGRVGVWHEEAEQTVTAISVLPAIEVHSVSTHLPSPEDDAEFTRDQLTIFRSLVDRVRRSFPTARAHVLNSAASCAYPADAHDLVRVGLLLCGSVAVPEFQSELRPALTWRTRIALVRDVPAGRTVSYGRSFTTPRAMRLATLTVGYADGYPRQASNRGAQVLIGGRRCAVLGRVTMDQLVVDVSDVRDVSPDTEVVLLGRQGAEEIPAAELATWSGTIAWDIFTGIGGRTVRTVAE